MHPFCLIPRVTLKIDTALKKSPAKFLLLLDTWGIGMIQ